MCIMKKVRIQNVLGGFVILLLLGVIFLIQSYTPRITDEEGYYTIEQNQFRLPIPEDWSVQLVDNSANTALQVQTRTFPILDFFTGGRLTPESKTGSVICGQYRTQDLVLQNPAVTGVQEAVIMQGNTEYVIALTDLSVQGLAQESTGVVSFRPVNETAASDLACELTTTGSIAKNIYNTLLKNTL